jgi:hypothetical protein
MVSHCFPRSSMIQTTMKLQVHDDAATSRRWCRKNRDKFWSLTALSNEAARSNRSGKVAVLATSWHEYCNERQWCRKIDNDVTSACERKWKSAMLPQQVGNYAAKIETRFGLSLLCPMKQQYPIGVGRWQLATSWHDCRNERQWCCKTTMMSQAPVSANGSWQWCRNKSAIMPQE